MCQNCNQNSCGGCTETTTVCNQCQSEQTTCDCAVLLSTDCSTYDQDPILYGAVEVVPKNTTLSIALDYIVQFFKTELEAVKKFLRIVNVGTGASIYAGDNLLGEKKIRTLTDSSLINLAQNTNDITISVDETALNTFIEANQKTYSISNIGTGAQIYKDSTVVGDNTQFNLKKLKSSNNSVTITEGTDDINLAILVDTVVTDGSLNPVTSNAVFDAFSAATTEVKKEYIVIPLSDLITNLTIGTTKAYFRMPFAATIDLVSASVLEAQTAGSIITFDINEGGTSILSTKLTIDNNVKTSITATTPPVISDTSLAYDSEITFDIDQIGTAGAKGAVITLSLTRV